MDTRMVIPGAAALMQRVRSGDKTALREFVARYGGSVYSTALTRTGNPLAARAIAKATLLDVIETPWCEDGDEAYAVWMQTLLERNMWQNAGESGQQAAPVIAKAPVDAPMPAEAPDAIMAQKPAAPPRRVMESRVRSAPAAPAFEEIWTALAGEMHLGTPGDQEDMQGERVNVRELWYGDDEAEQDTADELPDEAYTQALTTTRRKRKRRIGPVLLSMLLCLIIVVLLWGILGVLSDMGFLPPLPLGYDWFNTNVFPLF